MQLDTRGAIIIIDIIGTHLEYKIVCCNNAIPQLLEYKWDRIYR